MENEAIKTKVCSRCSMELPLSEFPKSSQCRGGHSGVCKKFGKCDMPMYNRVRCFQYKEESDLPW